MKISSYILLRDEAVSQVTRLSRWTLSHAIFILAAFAFALFQDAYQVLYLVAGISFLRLLLIYPDQIPTKAIRPHLANITTGARLLMLFPIGFLHTDMHIWFITGIAVLSLCLDGVDGYFARKFDGESDWGAYLDKEADAFFVLLLLGVMIEQAQLPAWMWSIALIRYVYVPISFRIKPVAQKEPRFKFGRFVAGILMGGLCFALVLPTYWATLGMTIIGAMVFLSFGRSFWLMVNK